MCSVQLFVAHVPDLPFRGVVTGLRLPRGFPVFDVLAHVRPERPLTIRAGAPDHENGRNEDQPQREKGSPAERPAEDPFAPFSLGLPGTRHAFPLPRNTKVTN